MNSLAERFNQSQNDFTVQIEYVPQAQARQKLISAITGGSPPDLCQVWDNWVGQFNGMGAVEDITARAGVAVGDRASVGAAFADIDNDGDPDLLVTSLQAAVLRDVASVLARRAPQVGLVLYPSSVQGASAGAEW